jgi:hypothetical protein
MNIVWASLLFFEGQELDAHNAVEPFSYRFSCSCQTASPFLAQVSCSALTCFVYRDRGVAIDRRFDGSLIVFDVCSVSVALPTEARRGFPAVSGGRAPVWTGSLIWGCVFYILVLVLRVSLLDQYQLLSGDGRVISVSRPHPQIVGCDIGTKTASHALR